MSGCLRNVPFLENSSVFTMSKEDGVEVEGAWKESIKLSQIIEIQDNLMPSFLFNFLLKKISRVGKLLNWLIWSSVFFLSFFFFTLSFQAVLLMSRGMAKTQGRKRRSPDNPQTR